MRTFIISLAALLIAAVVGLPSVASATDARQAVTLCEKNPNCSFFVRDNGSVDLSVDNCTDSGGACWINCPQEGDCTCQACIQAGDNVIRPNLNAVVNGTLAHIGTTPQVRGNLTPLTSTPTISGAR